MIVTFISECEKKALKRTRRVLDTFAGRIGNNTWQTPITEEGLETVKKLLKQTASKNTAVSCHQLKSRVRTELLWVVGKRQKFNKEGLVAVNYTNQDKFIGEFKTEQPYYANTRRQLLDKHLFAVGYVAYLLINKMMDDAKLAEAVFMAGCWHDIGKIDPAFQEWICKKTKKNLTDDIPEEGQHIDKKSGRFSFEKHPRHNEISLLFYHLLVKNNNKSINRANNKLVKHTIYWHHAKPIRKEEFTNLEIIHKQLLRSNHKNKSFDDMINSVNDLVKSINNICINYEIGLRLDGLLQKPDENKLDKQNLRQEKLEQYKTYVINDCVDEYDDDITINAKNNLARSSVITADRLVSSLTSDELNTHIDEKSLHKLLNKQLFLNSGLKENIQICLKGFKEKYPKSERNKEQHKAAKEIACKELEIGVLIAPAGCGKTKIALEWAFNTDVKKIIWVCPRVQICRGLLQLLISNEYLPNAKIEICTSEFKEIHQNGTETFTAENEEFSGDIVLTTIDQVINLITTHKKVTGLVEYMNSHVVFDEYHEYINMPAFNLLFAELVKCKKMQGTNANALLVSATPNYCFIEELLKIDENDIVSIESFNTSKYKLKFQKFDEKTENESNPLYAKQNVNTFVISNTAITAQKSFIRNQVDENTILFHSQYTTDDKKMLFDKIFQTFCKDGSKDYDILRSGPVVQASLNITCDKMITEFTCAENYLQRLGRLDRFGENNEPNVYKSAVPDTLPKQNGRCARFLNHQNCLQSAIVWFEFLQDKVTDEPITINQIYQIYKQFYENDKNREVVEQDLVKALKESVKVIDSKVIDPVNFPNKKKSNNKIKIKKNSLRGNSVFVQAAIINICNNKEEFPDKYACGESNNLTMETDRVEGYGDSNKNLLSFMAKKHHNIFGGTKTYKDFIRLNEARNPETPIYLSYTPGDLKKVEADPHPYAIYYAKGKKQPIGLYCINKLKGE